MLSVSSHNILTSLNISEHDNSLSLSTEMQLQYIFKNNLLDSKLYKIHPHSFWIILICRKSDFLTIMHMTKQKLNSTTIFEAFSAFSRRILFGRLHAGRLET